jgi:hypothetical protein
MFTLRFTETGQVVQVFKWGQANKETDERFGNIIKPIYEVN